MLETVYNAHTNTIISFSHSPNRNLVASGSYGTIKIWDAKTLKLKFAINDAHSSYVTDISFTPTSPFLLSASMDNTVNVIKIALLDSYEKRSAVLFAYLRFSEIVNLFQGDEFTKVHNATIAFDSDIKFSKIERKRLTAGELLQCVMRGGGPKGVLGVILSYV